MATKQQVIDLHRKHPELGASDIAKRLRCQSAYVRSTFQRNGIDNPGGGIIMELGRAAMRAGLTVADIEGPIGQARASGRHERQRRE